VTSPRSLIRALIAVLLIGAIGYFGYMGWAGSDQLVHPPNPNHDCRTPAVLGWDYEAINYDQATDADLLAGQPDPRDCSHQGAEPGDEVVSDDGIRIAGWWIPAGSPIPPDGPTVVLVHGYGDNKSGMLEDAVFLHDRWNLVLFDLRNSGQSTGDETTQGLNEQRDLEAMLDWVDANLHPSALAVFGQSMGGQTSVNVVARDPRVDALILESTHDRLSSAMAARIRNAGYPFGEVGFYAIVLGTWLRTGVNVLSADPIDAIVEMGSRPVLLIHGGGDTDAPTVGATRMFAAAEAAGIDVELHVCPGAGHGQTNDVCPDEYGTWMNDFLERTIGG
jgi:pimeloyl-ACP methyl ester carboxylesterase